jgi:FKBP-type peptidyl-prolyl cis-trans isomerase (trigger factor)
MDTDQLREETRPVAETRLKRSLVLFEVAEVEDIQVDPQQLQDETIRTMDLYSRIMPAKDFKRLTAKGAANNLVGNIMMELVIDNTHERLRNYARGIQPEIASSEGEAITEGEFESDAGSQLPEQAETSAESDTEVTATEVAVPDPAGEPASDPDSETSIQA